jgi:putative sigma-54 modulation protein
MQVIISGHHIEVTPSLRGYVENKVARLERHFEQITEAHVILSVDKLDQKAEATLQVNGATIYADAQSHDMYIAIDALVHKLDRQLKKHKEKNSGHQRGNGVHRNQSGA